MQRDREVCCDSPKPLIQLIRHNTVGGKKMNNLTIRQETEKDYRAVEELTREAFWNVYKPGADEHYYVHMMRNHPDFIPELAFVLEKDDEIIGNIMYTKAWLADENGERKEILSFGPLCVAPKFQRQKLGKILIEHSFDAARKMGYDVNINFGNPGNYVSRGFVSCKKKNVSFVTDGSIRLRFSFASLCRVCLTAESGCISPRLPPTVARTQLRWKPLMQPSPKKKRRGRQARRSSTSTAILRSSDNAQNPLRCQIGLRKTFTSALFTVTIPTSNRRPGVTSAIL